MSFIEYLKKKLIDIHWATAISVKINTLFFILKKKII